MINVKKLTETAKLPERAHDDDAGFDLFSDEDVVIPAMERKVIKTGISVSINFESTDYSCYLRIAPRSGLSVKKGIDVFAGVVDLGYRGEIMICLFNSSKEDFEIKKGDKIAQMIPTLILKTNIQEVNSLEDTSRGEKGFGSSGN
ncbi:MAG: dUTP diphosphatase [Candidatus ainarchaeum sp.]|jgi:deoxyuridine 5'-triphosphate nucleotidohydrolase|nr:dUTP diphosphatase [Candidatus ainarchaeum sp.]